MISPHGRGVSARANASIWGALPARGTFAVISPEGARPQARALLVGLGRPDRRPGADAGDRAAHAAVAADRPQPDLRVRRQHGRPGDAAPARAGIRSLLAGAAAFDSVADFARQYRSFPRSPCGKALPAQIWGGPIGREPAVARARGGRRHAEDAAGRLRRAQPGHLRALDRHLVRAAAALVERRRPDRRRTSTSSPARSSGGSRQLNPKAPVAGLRRLLGALARDAGRDAAAARARGLRAAAGDAGHDRPAPPPGARVGDLHAVARTAPAQRRRSQRRRLGSPRPLRRAVVRPR